MEDDSRHETESKASDDAEIKWPRAIATSVRMPPAGSLVFAWKPLINGWDIVPGRQVREAPQQYTHWLPMMPKPD